MPIAAVGAVSLNYTVHGTGEPVVLVAGSEARGYTWELHQVPALVRAGYQAITFDSRGVAPSGGVGSHFGLDEMVDDVEGLRTHLGLPSIRLVGMSLGALVAQEYALKHPSAVRQLVLMATRGRTDVFAEAMLRAELELDEAGLELPPRVRATKIALQNLSPATLLDASRARDWLQVLERAPAGPRVRSHLRAAIIGDRLAAYAGIACETLVMGFADDINVPSKMGREVAEAIPGARFVEIAGCGHFGYLERPGEVNHSLLGFFGG